MEDKRQIPQPPCPPQAEEEPAAAADELVERTAADILREHQAAFEELAK